MQSKINIDSHVYHIDSPHVCRRVTAMTATHLYTWADLTRVSLDAPSAEFETWPPDRAALVEFMGYVESYYKELTRGGQLSKEWRVVTDDDYVAIVISLSPKEQSCYFTLPYRSPRALAEAIVQREEEITNQEMHEANNLAHAFSRWCER